MQLIRSMDLDKKKKVNVHNNKDILTYTSSETRLVQHLQTNLRYLMSMPLLYPEPKYGWISS